MTTFSNKVGYWEMGLGVVYWKCTELQVLSRMAVGKVGLLFWFYRWKNRPRKTLTWQPLLKPQRMGSLCSPSRFPSPHHLPALVTFSEEAHASLRTSAPPERRPATGWELSVYGAVCFVYTVIPFHWSWAPPCRSGWCWVSCVTPSLQVILKIPPASPLAASHNWSIFWSPYCSRHISGETYAPSTLLWNSPLRAITPSHSWWLHFPCKSPDLFRTRDDHNFPNESQYGITLVLVAAMSLCMSIPGPPCFTPPSCLCTSSPPHSSGYWGRRVGYYGVLVAFPSQPQCGNTERHFSETSGS